MFSQRDTFIQLSYQVSIQIVYNNMELIFQLIFQGGPN